MKRGTIHTWPELMEYIDEIGFLPLLPMGIDGWSAEAATDEAAQYTVLENGSREWPLWAWKGSILQESGCAYGKFIDRKATFISRAWWPDFCHYRRSVFPYPEAGSIEEGILATLKEAGSLPTRELRAACGFDGPRMRSKFDGYVTRLEMGAYIVTEDFLYPRDRHGREYGWGWSLLTTPEALFGRSECRAPGTPAEARCRIMAHFKEILPGLPERVYHRLLK